jgi:hypothetical protein
MALSICKGMQVVEIGLFTLFPNYINSFFLGGGGSILAFIELCNILSSLVSKFFLVTQIEVVKNTFVLSPFLGFLLIYDSDFIIA